MPPVSEIPQSMQSVIVNTFPITDKKEDAQVPCDMRAK